MELWFIIAVFSAVFAGVGSFYNKVAVQRGYGAELIILYSALITTIVTLPFIALTNAWSGFSLPLFGVCFLAGVIGAFGGITKIKALACIDVTLFLPLFKVVSPLIVIIFGIVLFGETFSSSEWIGLIVSMLVPLLLINRIEHTRQKKLLLGLFYILLGGLLSAIVAAVNKYAVDIFPATLWIIESGNFGVFVGAAVGFAFRHRNEDILTRLKEGTSRGLIKASFWRGVTILAGFSCTVYALAYGGPLGIVYTINSLYILLPIVLSIIYYNEHWNFQKVVAIVLSILALGLLR